MNSHFGAELVYRKKEQNIQSNNKAKEDESSPALSPRFMPLCPVLVKKGVKIINLRSCIWDEQLATLLWTVSTDSFLKLSSGIYTNFCLQHSHNILKKND